MCVDGDVDVDVDVDDALGECPPAVVVADIVGLLGWLGGNINEVDDSFGVVVAFASLSATGAAGVA